MIELDDLARSGTLIVERNIFYWRTASLFEGSPDAEITFTNNLYWQVNAKGPISFADGLDLAAWKLREPGATVADPRFLDADHADFRLSPTSPAYSLGFEAFEFTAAGRQTPTSLTDALPPVPQAFFPAPAPLPVEVHQDFEAVQDGAVPTDFVLSVAASDQSIQVTSETAATGQRSLRFDDGPDGEVWQPHFFKNLSTTAGIWRLAFDLKVDPRAWVTFEGRDTDPWYSTGPHLEVRPGGFLWAGGKLLMQVPVKAWFNAELICGIGPQGTGAFQLVIRLPSTGERRQFGNLSLSPDFSSLDWLGFMSMSHERVSYEIDNLVVEPVGKPLHLAFQTLSGQIHLTWPLGAPSVRLFGSSTLNLSDWAAETNVPTPSNGVLRLTLPLSGPQRYFRLGDQ